jgi:hypothetical protein
MNQKTHRIKVALEKVSNARCQDIPGDFEDQSSQRECHAYAQGQNDQRVLAVIPRLHSVIPLIEHVQEGTYQADRQGYRADNYGRLRPHDMSLPLALDGGQ